MSTNNIAPRVGAVYDPFNDGRTKISAAYGQFYEAVPMDIAARYFGGENFIARAASRSRPATTERHQLDGQRRVDALLVPPLGSSMGDVAGATTTRTTPPVAQSHIQGQYHNEVVATLEREIMEDTTARLDYTHRWIGRVIEDGYGDPSFFDVLANPGDVPQQSLNDVKNAATKAQADADAAAMASAAAPKNQTLATQAASAQAKADFAKANVTTLQTLAGAPKPERTYDAITLTVAKRFSKNWFARGSYTYSRLVGNYEGLYQSENNYTAPNGSNAYDTPDLYVNNRGRLPNDHPHNAKLDGFYSHPVGPGKITLGLSFFARSGMPRNYMSNLVPGSTNQIVFLLPRGTAGRTPTETQFDGHIAYSQKMQRNVTLEAYIDFFNIFDQQATLIDRRQLHLRRRGADRQRHEEGPRVREERGRRPRHHERELRPRHSPTRRRSTAAWVSASCSSTASRRAPDRAPPSPTETRTRRPAPGRRFRFWGRARAGGALAPPSL